ncbi:MAG: hypothetical protein KDA25_06535, partial [Phycisphaerales bacterium]|nr:hypothetical protein [Phycisphaerales bacterium]
MSQAEPPTPPTTPRHPAPDASTPTVVPTMRPVVESLGEDLSILPTAIKVRSFNAWYGDFQA